MALGIYQTWSLFNGNIMDKKLYNKLKYLANKTRKAVEKLSRDECGWATLGGYCARSSAMLSDILLALKIPHKLIYSDWGHVYIECEGYVIDATCTQFGSWFPKVMIRSRHTLDFIAKDKINNWRVSKTFANAKELRGWQLKERWPHRQTINLNDLSYLKGVCTVKQKKSNQD